MKRNQSIIIALLSIFVAVGGISFAMKASSRTRCAENENANLRRQLAQLKEKHNQPQPEATAEAAPSVETTNTIVALKIPASNVATNPETIPEERPRRESFEDRMARMKAEDPEGYAEWIKRRTEYRETMKYNLAERTATFMDLDTSKMSDEELASHEQLVARMGRIWELMEQLGNPEEMNREAMHEMFREVRDVRPLMDQERTTMFRLLGEDLGYKGQDSQDFADHVDSIISATSIRMPHSGGRGGRGGGR